MIRLPSGSKAKQAAPPLAQPPLSMAAPPDPGDKLGSRTRRDNPLSNRQTIDPGLIIGSRMDRLASIAAFVRVVENGGFTAAARRLNLSPTMVSNHVQELEERLGARLLNAPRAG
jgi:Bacterial regulatory helix-turn-helix protein, lysR family